MKFLLSVVVSVLLFGCQAQEEQVVGANASAQEQSADSQMKPYAEVGVQEAQKLIASGEVVILDVRTDREFNSGHIEGAQQLDFFGDNFAASLEALAKDKRYLVYCASGNRSGKAIEVMKELNFNEAHNLKGGITAWKSNSLETVK